MVRLNNERVEQPSRPVRPGDVVTVALDRTVRVMRVVSFADRRGGPDVARGLYEDLTPAPAAAPLRDSLPERDPGAGRPTKRDRRELDRLRDIDDTD